MTKLRNAPCPTCGAEVTVTYWPYNVPLYTAHLVKGTNRDCGNSLRPVDVRAENHRPRPT
jgi:hypothetical protein